MCVTGSSCLHPCCYHHVRTMNSSFRPVHTAALLGGSSCACGSWFYQDSYFSPFELILPFWVCSVSDNRDITEIIPLFFSSRFWIDGILFWNPTSTSPTHLRVGLEAESVAFPLGMGTLDPDRRGSSAASVSRCPCVWPTSVSLSAFSSRLGMHMAWPSPPGLGGN